MRLTAGMVAIPLQSFVLFPDTQFALQEFVVYGTITSEEPTRITSGGDTQKVAYQSLGFWRVRAGSSEIDFIYPRPKANEDDEWQNDTGNDGGSRVLHDTVLLN